MPFRTQIKMLQLTKRCGWYAARQHMIKQGYEMQDIASVLAMRLRMLSQ